MEVEQIVVQLKEKISGAIHCIVTKEFAKILEYVKLGEEQKVDGKSDLESMKDWEKVINGQLALCEEEDDEGLYSHPLKVDEFDETLCEDDLDECAEELLEEGETCISYQLRSNGEVIDYLTNEFRVELSQEQVIEVFWSING
ncbi:MAG: hypothetical protein R3Y63_12960 [Eubacteriales bacterium]